VPEEVRNVMRFHPVSTIGEVFAIALEPESVAIAA
jgi:hypothetical protein